MTELTTLDQLEAFLSGTDGRPSFIFKHSTTCPISASAHRRVQSYLKQAEESGGLAPDFRLVRVHESRPVSNAIAERLGVAHKSPQLLLVRDGRCVWDTSHYDITAENIEKALHERAA
jgi:bacillithiol system protein YtxJ